MGKFVGALFVVLAVLTFLTVIGYSYWFDILRPDFSPGGHSGPGRADARVWPATYRFRSLPLRLAARSS